MNNRITEILNNHENSRIEFKTNFNSDVIETVCAFSNSFGGNVFVGISDKSKIIGIENLTDEIIKNWINNIKINTNPQIYPEIIIHKYEGKQIAEIVVQEYPVKPISCRGKFFKRIGSSNHLIQASEIAEMQILSTNSSFDSFVVENEIKELDFDLIDSFFREIKNTNRIKLTDNNENNLEKLKLTKNSKPTFASLLLFGNHNTGIHIGRFKTRDLIIDDILIKSPLIVAVNEALAFIQKNISVRFEFENKLKRNEIWQYPIPVIRELLLNAIIHRDYRNQTDIIIKIFDNSIEFTNPGGLPGNLKPEDLLTDYYIAVHRNKLLCEAFFLMGQIEKYGTGFIRIRNILKDYPNISLKYDTIDVFSRIIIEYNTVNNTNDPVKDTNDPVNDTNDIVNNTNDPVNDRLKKILNCIKENKNITRTEIANRCGVSLETIKRDIQNLKTQNKIKRIGADKGGHWQIIE